MVVDTEVDISRFVSLGDNCEFGFLQRAHGQEPGSLLRWAITNPEPLEKALTTGFSGLYEFENLTPSAVDMVLDNATGIFFHTRMSSKDGQFVDDEPTRKAVYDEEIKKMTYMVVKQLDQLKERNVFVYKKNAGVSFEQIRRIGAAIAAKGPGILLVITDKGTMPVGSVTHLRNNINIAKIDRFAPYNKADNISKAAWDQIVFNAAALIS